jgi:hypothetical protein
MPFAKGRSDNPGGRPKELRDVVDLARRHTPDAIESRARIMNSENSPPAALVAASVVLQRAAMVGASLDDARSHLPARGVCRSFSPTRLGYPVIPPAYLERSPTR